MGKRRYVFHPNERLFRVVSREVLAKMHQIAADLDLDKGGLFDSRGGGAINIWVSPSDKPADYTFEITKGRLNHPRNFLASIYPLFITDGRYVALYMVIHNFARRMLAERLLDEGKISYKEYREMVELSEKGTKEEWEWSLAKAKWLIETAEKEAAFREVVYCPFCGQEFPDLKLFNEFILHIRQHVNLKSIVLADDGIYLETEKGPIPPQEYVKVKRKPLS
jgi:hypothetical protein